MAHVYVGIGSNIEREANIRAAVQALRQRFGALTLSRVYESQPIGFEGENFYNLVAGFDTALPVEELLTELHAIEQNQGRKRSGKRFEARTLDLDLLLYDELVRHDDKLDLPRREILEYAFILKPLAEIASAQVHPETRQNFSELWKRFANDRKQLRVVEIKLA